MRWNSKALAAALLLGLGAGASAQQYTFEEVASGLTHADPATRLRAIQILTDADYQEAAGPIAAALQDVDDRVQFAAIDAERRLFTSRPISQRRKVGGIIEVRSVAGVDPAEGPLALKARAVPPELLPALTVALRDNNSRVRAAAIGLAALLAPLACVPDPRQCDQMGNALIENVNSREPVVRRSAMVALGQARIVSATQALADQFSYYQRGADALAAAEGLAGIGHASTASIFRDLLMNSNPDMRRMGVEGLARAGQRDALAEIQSLGASERSAAVLLALHFAVLKLEGTGGDLSQIIGGLRNSTLRPVALKYLLDLAPSRTPEIAAYLSDENPDVRRLVAGVLGFSRNAGAIPALSGAAKDEDLAVATAAQQAIARLNLP
jgi:HEAT repeat protein